MIKARTWPAGLPVTATAAQVAVARARLLELAARASAATGIGFDEVAPRYREVVATLPELRPVLSLAMELRPPILGALVDAGATIPRETWTRMGIEPFYRERAP